MDDDLLEIAFAAEVIHWRGPSPFFFVAVPPEYIEPIRQAARAVSYGWGMVPVAVTIDAVTFRTALFPKDDGYLLPLRDAVRRQARIGLGDIVALVLTVGAKADGLSSVRRKG